MDRFDQPVTPIWQAPGRRGRLAAGLLLVAVLLAGVALLAVVQPFQPAPTPLAPIALASPSSVSAPPSALVPGSLRPKGTAVLVTPSPSPVRTVPPTYPPDAFADRPEWRVSLTAPGAHQQVVSLIVDPAHRVVGGGPAPMRFLTVGFKGGVLPADSDHAVDVYWTGSICAAWELVTLDPDGTITVNSTPKDTPCTPGPTMRGLEMRFATRVTATSFSLVVGPERQYTADLNPSAVAFADPTHGLVAMADGLVAVGETADGGASWRLTTIGDGEPTGLAVVGTTAWTAIACDPSVWDHCSPGVYRRAGGAWTRVLAMDPGPMAVRGDAVAVLEQPLVADSTGLVPTPTAIRLTRDAGATWTTIPSPCPATLPRLSAVAFGATGLLAVCEVDPMTGDTGKVLMALSDETGVAWSVPAQLPQAGSDMGLSTIALASPPDVPRVAGILWGAGSPLLTTLDSGAHWTVRSDVADGVVRIVRSANAGTGQAMAALVWDADRNATLLLLSADSAKTWRELTSFLGAPCCGG